jgi:lysozyme
MDRPIQPILMVAGCAVLVVAAIALPSIVLQPARYVLPFSETQARQTPVAELQPPVAEIPVQPAPSAETLVQKAPSVETPVQQAPTTAIPAQPAPAAKAPARRKSAAKAPAAQTPAPQAPSVETATENETSGGDGLSRGQRFRIVEQETIKQLGPAAALTSSLAKAFRFPTARDDAIFGIDVSHHTTDNCSCQVDWDRVSSQKVAFVYAKATEGLKYKDPSFDKHWSELGKRPKIHRGAYHFLRADLDAEAQAKYFLAKMGTLEPGDLPPAVDLEWDTFQDSTRKWQPQDGKDYWSNLSPDEILAHALKWLQIVEKETGRIPVVYTSRTWWADRQISDVKLEVLKRYPIWISAMEDEDLRLEKPGVKGRWAGKWSWTLWQFTNMGDLSKAGIKNPRSSADERTDVSIYPGSLGQFQQAMGLAASIEVVDKSNPGTSNANSGAVPPSGVIAQTEPQKDTPVTAPTGTDDNLAKPVETNQAKAVITPGAGGGSVMPTETQQEPPKETQASNMPVAGDETSKPNVPNPPNVIAMPGLGGDTAVPTEPQIEAPKDTQVTDAPVTDGNQNKPAEPNQANVVATPGASGGSVVPTEPLKEAPKETQVTDAPVTGSPDKPAETNQANVVATPGASGGSVVPTEQLKEAPKDTQVTDAPVTGSLDKPVESNQANVVAIPSTSSGSVMPAERQNEAPKDTQVTDAPVNDGNPSKPVESNQANVVTTPGTVMPIEPQKAPAKNTEIASIPAATGGENSGSIPGAENNVSPSGAQPEKPVIEIVLKNGRVLRVEETIDPTVLTRLIAQLEK